MGLDSWKGKMRIVLRLGWTLGVRLRLYLSRAITFLMRITPHLNRIAGIRLRLHPTWTIAFILIIAVVVTQFPEAYPFWQRIVLGVVASLLFFIAVSIREIILGFLSLSKGIPVKRVTLFAFGGASQIAKEGTRPVLELLLVVAGLLTNLIIAGIFYAVHSVLVNTAYVVIDGLILWSAYMYFMLALFHFIPGFPLDVGRLLRMLLWKATGDYDRATGIASWAGQGFGLLFIVCGILLLALTSQWFSGLGLIFVGWILYIAAAQSRRQTVLWKALQGIAARDVMAKESLIAAPQLTVGQLVRDCILVTGQRYFVVAEGGKLQGIVTIRDIRQVPKERWNSTKISEIMTPASELKTAHAHQSTASLLEQMEELNIHQMPVLEEDKVIGIVARDTLIRLNKTRAELKM
jgi:CBS domain-containing protein/Zn-dependent protease